MMRTAWHLLQKICKSKVALHSYGWLLLFLLMAAADAFTVPGFLYAAKFTGLAMLPSYMHFYLLDRYLNRRRHWPYVILLVFLVAGSSWLVKLVLQTSKKDGVIPLMAAVITISVILATSAGIRSLSRGAKREVLLHELQSRQAQSELALLKHQTSPHFLFNTLNNLYALARQQEAFRTAEGIGRLARMMRYILEDAGSGTVGLTEEVEQINSYIELQKLRFAADDPVRLAFRVEGDPAGVRLAPMLLIPLVENAFKHSASLQQPTEIDMTLHTVPDRVCFTVKNTVNRQQQAGPVSGIGLANVRRRLELLYPEAHTLCLRDDGKYYRAELTLRPGGLRL